MQPTLATLLKDHQAKQLARRKDNETLRADASEAIKTLSTTLTEDVQQKVSVILSQQQEIERKTSELAGHTKKYALQTEKWLRSVQQFNDALKELGDVKHWAETMERDMLEVAATLEFVSQGMDEFQHNTITPAP
ncbi:hypothetical protein H4R34_001388 [Dimargaris verticillata]|uniref:Biogenesis of lysosome-related organelles complex 1 subunit 1 n=1 Tax=Dimargaris verticillata TaxID=2761393 RepID=A0A9W8B5L4_9FUNG|nr:hypothetical protein H4R34_001388 [Dimargaris verticillata]